MKKIIFLAFLITITGFLIGENAFGKTEWEDGILKWKSTDGAFQTRLDVRMYLDAAFYNENKTEIGNGFIVRRARFAVKSKLWEKWNGEFDIDVANNAVEIKDLWASYDFTKNATLQIGNFKPPFSLEELTSSRLLTFMERAYPNCFTSGRRMGSAFTYWRNHWRISSGIFGQEITDWKDRKTNKQKDQSLNYALRLTAVPLNSNKKIIHLGGGYLKITPDFESSSTDFDAYPETKVAPIKFLDTGDLDDVDYWTVGDLEAGLVYGPFSLQAEFMQTDVIRLNDLESLKFNGGYAFFSFFPTGESRPYSAKEGEFSQVIPRRKIGAFEIAFRYSHLNLTDINYEQPEGAEEEGDRIKGGKANNFTIGLNWYLNPNVRLITNYIFVDNSDFADGDGDFEPDDDFNFFQIRLLVNF
ncbi:MAG: hypothetical protein DRZ79_00755 [Candidatus Cloacimonadota bacterium]|nr:MAG: hypothetical protein DRZ79_00755 [Candidatus Cloacimonadota bacterium]